MHVSLRVEYILFIVFPKMKYRMYKTIILPTVLYKYEVWSLTLEGRTKIHSTKKVLRRIPGYKTDV